MAFVTPNTTQNIILVNTSTNWKIVNLPSAADAQGELFFIKDTEGYASTYFVYVSSSSGNTIDTRYNLVTISENFGALTLTANSTSNWNIVGSYNGSRVQSGLFSPYGESRMLLWLSAYNYPSLIFSPALDSNIVGWRDLSPQGNTTNFTEGRPIYYNNINFIGPAVNFDTATSDSMRGQLIQNGVTTSYTGSNLLSIVIVAPNAASSNFASVFSVGSNGVADSNALTRASMCCISTTATGWIIGTFRNSIFYNRFPVTVGGFLAAGDFMFTTYYSGTQVNTVYTDDLGTELFTSTSAVTGAFGFNLYGLGKDPGTNTTRMDGIFRESILYGSNQFTDYEIWSIESKISKKYSYSASLTSADSFLQLYHDPTVPTSWPGSGNTVFNVDSVNVNSPFIGTFSGTLSVVTTPGAVPFGYFTGFSNSGYILTNYAPVLSGLLPYTVEMWVYGTGNPATGDRYIFGGIGTNNSLLALGVSTNGALEWNQTNTSSQFSSVIKYNTSIWNSQYRHVVLSASATGGTIYVDGVSVATGNRVGGTFTPPTLTFGGVLIEGFAVGGLLTVPGFRLPYYRFYYGTAFAQSNVTYAYNRSRIRFNV